jgi:mRNA-degrading endonuclease RelE of RelBE toxin-antitoxin system
MRKLSPRHPDLLERFEEAISILSADPYNKNGKYPIKKLRDVPAGEGQFRLRSGRFRFRFDIAGSDVTLMYCGLRREDTY